MHLFILFLSIIFYKTLLFSQIYPEKFPKNPLPIFRKSRFPPKTSTVDQKNIASQNGFDYGQNVSDYSQNVFDYGQNVFDNGQNGFDYG